MRQKRAKTYKKLMALYSMSFGFRQPYQVLIDSEMCNAAVDLKLELLKQMASVLQGEVKPMITQCCIHELYLQGKEKQPAVDLAKTFERRKCNHREPVPGDECLEKVVGDSNKHRYVVATQSHPLRVKLRSIPAVPIVHINRSVMVLEPPSDLTLKVKAENEEKALLPTALAPSMEPAPKKKKKGPKGPNPLSVKKKKTPTAVKPEATGEKRKRDDEADEQPTRKRKRRRKTESAEAPNGT
ncbi:Fcf1-domain-containing protein [Mycena floridula]|nr:Fcf1-domain-containing protein [Mycena floridula]